MALASLFKKTSKEEGIETKGLLGEGQLFCSFAIANFYNLAAAELDQGAPIPGEAENMSPQEMMALLEKSVNWKHVAKVGKGT